MSCKGGFCKQISTLAANHLHVLRLGQCVFGFSQILVTQHFLATSMGTVAGDHEMKTRTG